MGSSKQKKKRNPDVSIRRFGIIYIVLMGVFFFIIGFVPLQKVLDVNGLYTRVVVISTAKILGIMRIPCTFEGSLIHLPSISLDVKFGCNGLEAVMIYAVAVLAFLASLKKKILGIVAGFFIIQTINIIRIAALAYSGVYFRSFFEYIHIYIAQGMMIAVSLGIFFLYLAHIERNARTT
jgi:exosortase/archaeosortase family protein